MKEEVDASSEDGGGDIDRTGSFGGKSKSRRKGTGRLLWAVLHGVGEEAVGQALT